MPCQTNENFNNTRRTHNIKSSVHSKRHFFGSPDSLCTCKAEGADRFSLRDFHVIPKVYLELEYNQCRLSFLSLKKFNAVFIVVVNIRITKSGLGSKTKTLISSEWNVSGKVS